MLTWINKLSTSVKFAKSITIKVGWHLFVVIFFFLSFFHFSFFSLYLLLINISVFLFFLFSFLFCFLFCFLSFFLSFFLLVFSFHISYIVIGFVTKCESRRRTFWSDFDRLWVLLFYMLQNFYNDSKNSSFITKICNDKIIP